ncbi:GntR family transcriptional regulator [Microbacterium sp. gxy059]|uniref:GntR family transcriptional regulator n=1 Tax=Microbacterium sp. gxy059 TaxID=2957199 RepID=UPI003D960EA2
MAQVRRTEPLGAQVAAILRQRIVRGELAPGQRMTEEALAEEFGVSRGPVRDAITRLGYERLVEVHKPRGIYVIGLDDDDVEQLYSLRGALEQLALRRAMTVTDESRWEPMLACVEELAVAADASDHETFLDADLRFHTLLYDLADHPRLRATWRQHLPLFEALLQVTIDHDQDLHESAEAHRRLYEVLRAGDPVIAAAELQSHLAGAERRMRLELDARV